ncbi:MAG: putative glycoside hydrolase [Hydrogenoanaerobacterium sp.]
MSKGFKVRRTKTRIYRRNRSKSHSPLGIAAAVLFVAGLFVLGWFVYPPVYDLITGKTSLKIKPDAVSSAPSVSPSEIVTLTPEKPAEPEPEPKSDELKMLYAPYDIVKNAAELEKLAQKAKAAGCNTLLFEVKDNNGNVLYKTANETALNSGAVAKDAFDLKQVAEALAKHGLKPAVRLHTFKDHAVSRKNVEMAVHYMNSSGLWLDNYADKGGRSWLNPYDSSAQEYNIALAQECADVGAVLVIADSVQFPNAVGMNLASYGDTHDVTWEQTLEQFVVKMEDALTQKGAQLAVGAVGSSVTSGYSKLEYLGKPLQYKAQLAINCMPAYWEWQSPKPNEAPVKTAGATLSQTLKPVQAAKKELIPYVQCYTDSKIKEVNNKPYTKAEVDEQLAVLKELGLESYILYSPDGIYPF